MKRLTEVEENGVIYVDFSKHKESAMHRLATIEDILGDDYDLERLRELVNHRMTMREDVAERMKLVGSIPIDHLQEIVEADRDGRCVVLPVKNGDKVYCLQSYFDDAKIRSEKKVKCRTVDFVQSAPDLFECDGVIYKFHDIGKTVFLTREAAESELKGEQE